jgi:glutamate-ammonia-ligase adenylyltransferase
MDELFFRAPLIGLPQVTNEDRVIHGLEDLRRRAAEGAAEGDDGALLGWVGEVVEDPLGRELLGSVISNSPFLTTCMLGDLGFLKDLLTLGPGTCFDRVIGHLKDDLGRTTDQDHLKRELRRARRQVALLVALADVTGLWPLERITQSLSDFADVALSATISHLLLQAAEGGDLVLADDYFPEVDCGYVALAMGKHGARELNYSSDIDLIVLYEPMKLDYRGSKSLQEALVRATRTLSAILQERTADGYVCRVDLRLRPDPASTPLALSCAAARAYYASRGENWERAAMIKARPAAGDIALGQAFLDELTPFVWREDLDFWMLREIQSIKTRINVHKGSGEIACPGHNVKLGRGGIREIEFFAQTQQLIFGGRDPYLRCLRSVDALTHLSEAGCIDEQVADELTEAYEFLRQLEHRLQMVDDQQTQTLPSDEAGLARIAGFMAYDSLEDFQDALLYHLHRVEFHYNGLFEETPGQTTVGSLSVAGEQPDEATAELLAHYGFQDVAGTYGRLRAWHEPAFGVGRDERSCELFAELVPPALEAIARRPDPDGALARFEAFFAGLHAGRRHLSLLSTNPALLDLLIEVIDSAPALATELRRRPELLQHALSDGFFTLMPVKRLLAADLSQVLGAVTDSQELLERAVPWTQEHRFQIAVNTLRHGIDSTDAGQALSDLADTVVQQVHDRLSKSPALAAELSGVETAVLAFGPYGARELGLRRSLELLFLHDGEAAPTALVARLVRRVAAVLSAPTGDGLLYGINLASSLWGGPGPLVTSLDGFREFCATTEEPRPLLALGQMRVVAGSPGFAGEIAEALRGLVATRRDPVVVSAAVPPAPVETQDEAAGPSSHPRSCPGGLDDLDFLVRALQLTHGPDHPELMGTSLRAALAGLGERGLMESERVGRLLEAHRLFRQMENLLEVALEDAGDWPTAPEGLHGALIRASGQPDMAALHGSLEHASEIVREELANLAQ